MNKIKNQYSEEKLFQLDLEEFLAKDLPVYAIEDYGEVKIYFRPKKVNLDVDAVKEALNGLVFNGDCTGYDIDRITNGDIWVYFNPTHHNSYHRSRAIDKVTEALCKKQVFTEDYD